MKIGPIEIKLPLFFAPMAGISDLPTRLIARDFGVGMAYTEMVSANALVMKNKKTERLFLSAEKDNPLGVQIFGSDPDTMAQCARIMQEKGVSLIDINVGCPVRKIVKSNSGAALLKNLSLLEKILKNIIKVVTIPVTIKLRSGWGTDGLGMEAAILAEQCGLSAVTVHARTALQGYSVPADWKIIADVKRELSIPVIGNGDIRTAADATRMFKETGCDGVMIGRGAIGNPWIFRQCSELLHGNSVTEITSQEKCDVILRHLDALTGHYGNRIGLKIIRTHISKYTKGLTGSAKFRELINGINDIEEFKLQTINFFC